MEIKLDIKIPKFVPTKIFRINVDEEEFKKDLIKFINNVENEGFFDGSLYEKIINYGVNKKEFDKMTVELNKFSEYDDDKSSIGFPYEDWIDRLLEVYTDKSINKV